MAQKKNETSGTTETQINVTTEPCCPEPRHFGLIETIWDEDYDEELNMCIFHLGFYNGEQISISMKPQHIKQMTLFLSKEEANQRYIQHIMKNH
jgi:hypothetical protein